MCNVQETMETADGAVESAEVLALVGDYDIFSARDLESQIRSIAERGLTVALDFTQCTYVDSSILTVLVRAVRSYGDQLHMLVPKNGNVARILSVTQLDSFFPIVAS